MKQVKKIISLILVALLVFSAAGCHAKDETAITLNSTKLTTAMYLACMVNAYTEGMQKVSEATGSQQVTDFADQTIDDMAFNVWVENRALEQAKQFAALKALFDAGKYTISDEDEKEALEAADYYWNSYGYSVLFEKNGVNYETYKQVVRYSYMSESYFQSIYGDGGTSPVAESDVSAAFTKNFEIVNKVTTSFTSETTDDEKKTKKAKLDEYCENLNKGKMTFEEVYKEFNGYTNEDMESMKKQAKESSEETPIDLFANATGGANTSYADENFTAIKAMKVDEAKVFSLSDGNYSLVIRKDITTDPYFAKNMKDQVLHLLKDDDFDKVIADYVKAATVTVNKYATDRIKPDNIDVSTPQ